MLDNFTFTDTRQIKAYADPIRLRILNLLIDKPMTGAKLARLLDIPRQRIHYHLHILEENGLIALEEERIHRGLLEKVYRATARNFHTPASRLLEGGPDLVREAGIGDSMIQSMLEVAALDLSKRSPLPKADLPDHHLQGGTFLTEEQYRALAKDMHAVYRKFEEFEANNRSREKQDDKQNMVYSRITLFLMQIRDPLENGSDNGEAEDASRDAPVNGDDPQAEEKSA